jgi:Kef-type K+ transport system membrane component KefB
LSRARGTPLNAPTIIPIELATRVAAAALACALVAFARPAFAAGDAAPTDAAQAAGGPFAEDAAPTADPAAGAPSWDAPSWEGREPGPPPRAAEREAVERGPGFVQLPPAEPAPAVAPIIDGKDPAAERRAVPVPARERPEVVIKIIFGLLGVVALAYLAAHPAVQKLERVLGISQVITAGFPFVVLGMIARRPEVGILTDDVVAELSPALRIGLGWIGLVVGFRFHVRTLGELPPGGARVIALGTLLPFAAVLAASGAVLLLLTGDPGTALFRDPVFVRDALILGTAAAVTAMPPQRLAPTASESALSRIVRGEELAGLAGLAVVAAFFRPHAGATWQLPGTAWLLLTLGLGAAIGLLTYAILQRPHDEPEFVVLTLGCVSFAAGLAGYLRLSPVVVAFIAGVLLANFPGAYKERLGATLRRLERPIYLLSLTVIGALWDVSDWRGWLLMPLFAVARLAGKWVAVHGAARWGDVVLALPERRALAVAPMGPLAIAIVVNAQLQYPGGSISLIVSSVIGGAILTEVFVQLWGRFGGAGPQPLPARAAPEGAAGPQGAGRRATGGVSGKGRP